MTLMSLGGFALTSDHTHLVYQRDTLKAATDAASFATSRHWQQALGHLTDDDDIKAALLAHSQALHPGQHPGEPARESRGNADG